jgi:hypothetical protein
LEKQKSKQPITEVKTQLLVNETKQILPTLSGATNVHAHNMMLQAHNNSYLPQQLAPIV